MHEPYFPQETHLINRRLISIMLIARKGFAHSFVSLFRPLINLMANHSSMRIPISTLLLNHKVSAFQRVVRMTTAVTRKSMRFFRDDEDGHFKFNLLLNSHFSWREKWYGLCQLRSSIGECGFFFGRVCQR